MAGSAATSNRSSVLPTGTPAPDFELPAGPEKTTKLSDLRGHPVILAFYPADWSPVCGEEVVLFNEILSEFKEYDAEILGISVDGVWCHAAFAREKHLHFPLLSDFEPKGAVSRAYGAYHADGGVSERALFVIDRDGIICWSYLSPMDVNPGAAGILSALESLSSRAPTAGASTSAEAGGRA